jgi:MGT family glycosyltransferase
MSHIGLITPAYTGHVSPMITLGRELQRRGHRVSVVSIPDAQEPVVRSDLEFVAVGGTRFPVGSLERFTARLGQLVGLRAVRFTFENLAGIAAAQAGELADAVTGAGMDALVVDQFQPIGAAVAQRFDIPFVSACNHMPLNTDIGVPPWMLPWAAGDSAWARTRNRIGYRIRDLLERPLVAEANRTRVGWGMAAVPADEHFSKLAQLAQIPGFFDFPRKQAPRWFHHTGPLTDFNSVSAVPFPWDELDGRPLIYASMGTLQNRSELVFRTIAEACAGLDAQLVIALGRRGARIPADFPGKPIVVDYAPQVDLLARASLYIGHGGMNTTLHALASGVPMVILPVAADNPGIAARAKRLGVAEFLPIGKVNARRLRALTETVRANPAYRDNALKHQDSIRGADAVGTAADIVEEAFRTGRPVVRAADEAMA